MNNFKERLARGFRNPINLAFVVSVLYWIYLVLTSRMVIVYDATAYEALGKMIANQGWVEFFRTGPNREPFYPALIAFSMALGKFFGISYQLAQVIIQLLIVFLTQILTLRILRILKINNLLSALTIFYLGISPVIVNSALSLFSEIAVYPLVLGGMFLIYRSWVSFTGPKFKIILPAIAAGLVFALMVLSKGIFEFVIPVFLLLLLVCVFCTRNQKLISNILKYLLAVLMIFTILVSGYKSVNLIFNGRFIVTNFGATSFYSCIVRRMEPLTKKRFLTALAYVPGEGVCQSMFGEEECRFWSFWKADEFGSQKVSELKDMHMSAEAVDKNLTALAIKKVLENPVQFILLFSIESAKMFFWESTQNGYVVYPAGLAKLFAWAPLKNGLRLAMAFLTLLAVSYLFILLCRKRNDVLKSESPLLFIYFCLLFIFSFVSLYSVFSIIARYLLPIVPLFLIIIVYAFQDICFRISRKINASRKYVNFPNRNLE